jgi:hypothetical protein
LRGRRRLKDDDAPRRGKKRSDEQLARADVGWNGKQAALTRLPNITGHPEVKKVRHGQGKLAVSIVATKEELPIRETRTGMRVLLFPRTV